MFEHTLKPVLCANTFRRNVLRRIYRDVPFKIAVLNLRSNSLKNTCNGVQFLVNVRVTLSYF